VFEVTVDAPALLPGNGLWPCGISVALRATATAMGNWRLGERLLEVFWVTVGFPTWLLNNGFGSRKISADLRQAATGAYWETTRMKPVGLPLKRVTGTRMDWLVPVPMMLV